MNSGPIQGSSRNESRLGEDNPAAMPSLSEASSQTEPEISAAVQERINALINPEFTLAPGVELNNRRTWLTRSRFTAADYQDGEGLPDWELAKTSPGTIQKIRAYLIV
ncbi:MAG: hypothetical protein KDD60_03020, partial [Bdellovibrionales bacterium]|nr:hypothetical protein [Bdellovibrionales bacterium]